jgi:hypothetical protein
VHEPRQGLEVVAALEHRADAGARPVQRRASSRKPRPVSSIDASGSSVCASKPAETISRSGLEPPNRGLHDLLERAHVLLVARSCGQRDVHGGVVALAGPAGARVERPLVERHVEDARVVPEDVLRAVPVVDVPVEDRHPLERVLRLCRPSRDRGVVEEAEAHRAVGRRVVAGRPDECKTPGSGRLDRPACGDQRRLEAGRRGRRIPVEPGVGVDRANPGDMLGRVAALDLLDRRRAATRASRRPRRAAPPAAVATPDGGSSDAGPRQRGVARPPPSAGRERPRALPARWQRPHDSAK